MSAGGAGEAAVSGAGAGIAVIVPVLDEEARVGGLLDALAAQPGLGPVVIVDGGSADRTVEVARARGATVIAAPRGRAAQMNAGAAATGGEVLLFLHADTRLPSGAAAQIRGVLAEPGTVAGAFRTWTVNDDPRGRRRWLAPLLHLADVRSRVRRLPYGDQALFVRRDAFEAVGSPPLPLMEDLAPAEAPRRRRAETGAALRWSALECATRRTCWLRDGSCTNYCRVQRTRVVARSGRPRARPKAWRQPSGVRSRAG